MGRVGGMGCGLDVGSGIYLMDDPIRHHLGHRYDLSIGLIRRDRRFP